MKLRCATQDDIDELTSIINRAYVAAIGALAPAAYVREFSERGGHCKYVFNTWQDFITAEDMGTIKGFVHRNGNEIVALFVDPNDQNQGYGTALMKEALAKMRGDGHKNAILRTTQGNIQALRFYQKLGWKAADRELRSLGTQARWTATLIVMTNSLEESERPVEQSSRS